MPQTKRKFIENKDDIIEIDAAFKQKLNFDTSKKSFGSSSNSFNSDSKFYSSGASSSPSNCTSNADNTMFLSAQNTKKIKIDQKNTFLSPKKCLYDALEYQLPCHLIEMVILYYKIEVKQGRILVAKDTSQKWHIGKVEKIRASMEEDCAQIEFIHWQNEEWGIWYSEYSKNLRELDAISHFKFNNLQYSVFSLCAILHISNLNLDNVANILYMIYREKSNQLLTRESLQSQYIAPPYLCNHIRPSLIADGKINIKKRRKMISTETMVDNTNMAQFQQRKQQKQQKQFNTIDGARLKKKSSRVPKELQSSISSAHPGAYDLSDFKPYRYNHKVTNDQKIISDLNMQYNQNNNPAYLLWNVFNLEELVYRLFNCALNKKIETAFLSSDEKKILKELRTTTKDKRKLLSIFLRKVSTLIYKNLNQQIQSLCLFAINSTIPLAVYEVYVMHALKIKIAAYTLIEHLPSVFYTIPYSMECGFSDKI